AASGSLEGTALAFALDALTFAISVLTLWAIRLDGKVTTPSTETDADNVLASIRAGMRHAWEDRSMRATFILIAVGNFLVMGALTVGIPVLADTRFPEGAAAFGILMSAFGGGSLLGTLLAMVLPQPPARWLGGVLGVTWSVLGLGIAALGLIAVTLPAAAVLLITGVAIGYVQILFITWLQKRTPEQMMGRVMSLLMFASMGLQPISEAVTGAVARVDPALLFVGGGVLMTAFTLIALVSPGLRNMGDMPEPELVTSQA
ncbi:MAG: MFS transporter, partial [Anaerolineae bacterium]|nr:MFS transporter [Anaerolineae bacterium]